MNGRASIVAMLLCAGVPMLSAQSVPELRWDHNLVHYTPAEAPAYDAWVITPPASGSDSTQDLAAVAEDISHAANTSIAHIFLADWVRRPELQEAVMKFLTAQPEFRKNPPPTGFGRWEFKNSRKVRALVEKGLLGSPLVADCNAVLGKYGKSIRSVSMEKLFFTKKDGQWGWDAMVWLMVDPAPNAAAKSGGEK